MVMTHHPFPWTRLRPDLSSLVSLSPLIELTLFYYVLLIFSEASEPHSPSLSLCSLSFYRQGGLHTSPLKHFVFLMIQCGNNLACVIPSGAQDKIMNL